MNIKYLTYARYSTSTIIHSVNAESNNKELNSDALTIFSKIRGLKLKVDERQKFKTSYGVWFVKHDKNDISYALCTSDEYPERHAFALIQELQKKISEITHAEYETEDNIKSFSKKAAAYLASHYNDIRNIDNIQKALGNVKEVQSELGEGIKKLINNKQSLQDLDQRATKMKEFAGDFEKNAHELQRLLYWRNMKIKILVALIIIGLLGFIILIIVQRTKQTS